MHKLLARQLRKAAEGSPDGTVDMARLIEMVDLAYEESERERRLKDRALDVMQDEVEEMSRRVAAEAEQRFNLLMDNVGEAVIVIGARGQIEAFNREAEKIFGYLAGEAIGHNIAFLMPADLAAVHGSFLAQAESHGNTRILGKGGRELLGKRKNGEIFPAEIAIGEVTSGGYRQFIGVIRDITLRRQAEIELRESESRFRDLAGSASDWFWESDADHRLTFVSERIGSVLGVKPAAILGHTWLEIGLDDQPERAAAYREDLAAHASFRDLVFTVGPPDGKDGKVIRLSAIPMFSPDGAFTGYRGVGADITREASAVERAIQAREQLRDAIDSITDAIAVYDNSEKLVICNQAYADTLDRAHEFLFTGILFEDVLRNGHQRKFFDIGDQDFDEWLVGRLDRFRNADGHSFVVKLSGERWVQSRECPTREGGVVAVRTDITRLKRREEDLDQLRRRYELILDSAGEGIVGLDSCGRVTFANRMAGEIIGRHPAEMVGQCFHCLVHPDPLHCGGPCPASASPVVEAYLSGTPGQVSGEVFREGGQRGIPVDYFVAPIIENEEPSGAVLVFRDATLRLQSERSLEQQQRELAHLVAERTRELQREIDIRAHTETALRGSRERLKGITDSLFEGVLVVDREGYISFANPSAKQLLECDENSGDIEGYPLDILLRVRTPTGDVIFRNSPFRRVIQENVTFRDDDAAFITASDKALSVAYACSPLGEDEDKRSVIISFRNIETLKKAQREAVQASRLASVGQLAAGIAHEINTPIQYVGDNLRFIDNALGKLGAAVAAGRELAASAMAHPAMSEPVDKFNTAFANAKIPFLMAEVPAAVSESLDGVAQIARIVLSMKEFSHPGTSTKTMTDMNRALDSTLTVSRNVWKHAAEMVRNFDLSLPPVLCHAGELNQVFLNLIVNAAHAIEASGKPLPGCITVSTTQRDDHVEISVADSGTGVPEAIRERIFDPFFTTKEVGKGTGQGLAICRDVVVAKHGGSMDVADNDGGGAVFIVRLPISGTGEPGARE
ncbi:Signal transduction histidine kinase [Paramagnetospirillum caucaseum]|uniref:histidine kinase n=1 Tax=Paramagnetospirillum caucaseum TaxID=1244869 RepID=M3A7S2_9PROT|nr:PAS domain S-box protein [Paramagnetospirillum caucaseum]EME68848.1 Signal transduction histidine kinase [Paramagnetospirillum caucaseum]